MSGKSGMWRWVPVFWLLAIVGLLAAGFTSHGLRQLFTEAVGIVTPESVLVTLPAQAVAILLCAAALRVLGPGVSLLGCLGARLMRDAGYNLLVFLPGLGELIGARALVLAGGRSRSAVAATALDRIAEASAQIPFIVIAALVLLYHWGASPEAIAEALTSLQAIAAIVAAGFVLALALRKLMRAREGPAGRLAAWIREELRLVSEEFHRQKGGFPAATGLHFLGWLLSGVQIWLAARAFGLHPSLVEAIVLEAAASAGRTILFFIPAGLAAQEAALVAAGLVFGITAPQSLALGLVLRLRDVIFGLPLLFWPALEFRHGRKAGEGSVQ
jgi:uncharacterized membrane protein YbhN (UPF0104 family)